MCSDQLNAQKIITMENRTLKILYSKLKIKNVYVGDKVFSFETKDIKVKFSLDLGFHDNKYSFSYGEENIYFMLHQKKIQWEKDEYQYLYQKMTN